MSILSQKLREIIPQLRSKYGTIYLLDVSTFSSELGATLLLRPMTRIEFNNFTNNYLIEPVTTVRDLWSRCVLHSTVTNLDKCNAGIDEFLIRTLSMISGFAEEQDIINGVNESRQYARTLEAAITIKICKAFPGITPIDVENMTFEQQMKYVSMAEIMLGQELNYMAFLHPEKEEKVNRQVNKPPRRFLDNAPPIPQGFMSAGGAPQAEPGDKHVVVTKENLLDVIKESNKVFGVNG